MTYWTYQHDRRGEQINVEYHEIERDSPHLTRRKVMDRTVVIQAAIARVYARIEGMKAANREREDHGYALAYNEQAFLSLIEEEGIGTNQVICYLQDQ